ncbi:unnamed protein product, partial [Polarella glacialis]
AFEKLFDCPVTDETMSFQKPSAGECHAALKERKVDFSAVERYVRATAVAVFARQAALAGSRLLGQDDECGWVAMAEELGFEELHSALKKCKPWDWNEAAKTQGEAELQEEAYAATVEAWFLEDVLPELETERRLALR